MKSYILFGLVALTSCALLDGYKDNRHSWFEQGLTVEEKNRIKAAGAIHKEWNGTNGYGMLFITPMQGNPKNYNFVEIGEWNEESPYESNGIQRGIDKRWTNYDRYGNILERKIWDKPKDASEFFLLEEWKSFYQVKGTDTALIQDIATYYPNGKQAWKFKQVVTDYNTMLSDRLKSKLSIDTTYHYSPEGKLIETKIHNKIN